MIDSASLTQMAAADPSASVWLQANAGSGKTKVLIDRVARLLMSGVDPQHVLCLTYTKAAAAEMQNRLFSRLGQWAMMADDKLAAALDALGPLDGKVTPDIARARQLFARAIETPGGLRIQTIHSFCSALLRRFPLEAGVSPQFREVDDRSAILMRSEIAQEIAAGPHAASFAALAAVYTDDDLDNLLGQIAGARYDIAEFLDDADARALFGVPMGETLGGIIGDVFLGKERQMIDTIMPYLDPAHRYEGPWLNKLASLPRDIANVRSLILLEGILLSGYETKNPSAAKVGKFPNAKACAALGNASADWDAFMLRVQEARPRRVALQAAIKTTALHGFARHFIPAFEARKAAQGMLDFDDLIVRARDLLTNHSLAQWVLYRLDGGIEHILVDEAQDTSPAQWEVLERLAEAFMDGDRSRRRSRTIFVVGDRKQSIYSFQGADVAAFEDMKERFDNRLRQVGQRLQICEMQHSFRSSPAILDVVDATFDRAETQSGGAKTEHIAFFDQMPGRVELWPVLDPQTAPEDQDGFSPVDLTTDEHHAVRMGNKVADWIADALATGLQIATRGGERPAHAGDFLVLVQKRSKIFDAVINACKAKNLPISGADRLVLGEELAVQDLMALLSFLATDSDDLSLAMVMRSPLGECSEAQLYELAHGRPGSLWLQLVAHAGVYPALFGMLDDLRRKADLLRPYDLLERALTWHGARLRLVARLGQEAEDAIDELLTQALAYEASEVPSITGFLSWLTAGDVQVKRQVETAGRQIRVMTVHGAKGLESPVVILPDTADQQTKDRDQVIKLPSNRTDAGANRQTVEPVIWTTSAADSPTAVLQEKARRKERREAEADRLLYVAMTRAESLLIVAAAGKISENSKSWHRKIAAGMERLGAATDHAGVRIHQHGSWPKDRLMATDAQRQTILPGWIKTAPPLPFLAKKVLNPTALGGAKALPGEAGQDPEIAMARGGRLHLLLERLPPIDASQWQAMAQAMGAEDVFDEARAAILQHSAVFATDTLAEVPIAAALGGQQMLGVIDRLIVDDARVLAVDFKSNRVVPRTEAEVPEGILRQMGAYAAALQQIYPEKRIETAILWTQTAALMTLDPDIVSAALSRSLSLDVSALGA